MTLSNQDLADLQQAAANLRDAEVAMRRGLKKSNFLAREALEVAAVDLDDKSRALLSVIALILKRATDEPAS